MSDLRIATFHAEVEKVLQHLKQEFGKLQTGRANASLVEHIDVEAYGVRQQLRAIAGVSVQDARTIVIQPWDRTVLQAIEKALSLVDLGSSPVNDGVVIRITLPPMTEERRSHLKKVVSSLSEEAKITVRKHRQNALDSIKTEKDEDVKETLQKDLQKAVEEANAQIQDAAKKKEEEVMKV
ncbi:MAG: ribosome recycling factor [Candidatus Peribacteraceae bacterium]|nr:ribosome recycling factor [Candidatus Peribacteraceae bacterium]